MNKKQLLAFKADVEKVLADRQAAGDYDVNAKYMRFLLGNMAQLIDHAITQYPKGQKNQK